MKQEGRSEAEKEDKLDICQANTEDRALLVARTKRKLKHIKAIGRVVLEAMSGKSVLVSTQVGRLIGVIP